MLGERGLKVVITILAVFYQVIFIYYIYISPHQCLYIDVFFSAVHHVEVVQIHVGKLSVQVHIILPGTKAPHGQLLSNHSRTSFLPQSDCQALPLIIQNKIQYKKNYSLVLEFARCGQLNSRTLCCCIYVMPLNLQDLYNVMDNDQTFFHQVKLKVG